MKITMLLATILFAGAAQAGTCKSEDRTMAATVADGQISIVRLNGFVPGAIVVKSAELVSPIDIQGSRGVQIIRASSDDGGKVVIRMETENGDQNLANAKLKSIRVIEKDGTSMRFATDCQDERD